MVGPRVAGRTVADRSQSLATATATPQRIPLTELGCNATLRACHELLWRAAMLNEKEWFTEVVEGDGSAFSLRIRRKLHEEQSPYQTIAV